MLEARPVVFKSGSLAKALRATMSIPGVFTPVEMDNRVLADGGLLNNIPTDVAKDMGADVVIAVNVGTPLGTREDIVSLAGMLSQIIGVATIESDRRHLQLADLAITPNLGKYTLLDFKAVDAIANLGYEAATQNGAALEKFALNETEWQSYLAARESRRRSPFQPLAHLTSMVCSGELGRDQTHLNLDFNQPIDPISLGSELSIIRGTDATKS